MAKRKDKRPNTAEAEAAYYRLKLEEVMMRLDDVMHKHEAAKLVVWIERELQNSPGHVAEYFATAYAKMHTLVEEKRVSIAADLMEDLDNFQDQGFELPEDPSERAKAKALRFAQMYGGRPGTGKKVRD